MSQEFCRHVFDAFERERNGASAQAEGSGLGLAITKRLVEEMDGYAAARHPGPADEKQASVPIIAVTANAFEEDQAGYPGRGHERPHPQAHRRKPAAPAAGGLFERENITRGHRRRRQKRRCGVCPVALDTAPVG